MERLFAELVKASDNLSEIKFTINGEDFIFYFRYLTLLEKVRIEQMAIKPITTIKDDGSQEIKYEKQEHLIPIYTIIEKALDKDGNRLFSHTNDNHFKMISKLPAGVASFVAYEMSMDIMGSMKVEK